MATWYLINTTTIGTEKRLAGRLFDDAIESLTPWQNGGALFYPSSDVTVAAAAAVCASKHAQGANEALLDAIMNAAVDSSQKAQQATDQATDLAEKFDAGRLATVADDATVGGIEVVYVVDIADGATADKDVIVTKKFEVTQIEVLKKAGAGGASDTIQVKNLTDVITDAMSINVADKIIVRPATMDDAFTVFAAAGTLRVTKTKASAANVACRVIVRGVLRA